MSIVHVFYSNHRFNSYEALRSFVDPTHTEDGDMVPSLFMAEVGMASFEPTCIEVEAIATPLPLRELLEGASYGHQWVPMLSDAIVANGVICVFEPNQVAHPSAAKSVRYCGAYEFSIG